ncbi:MAG TPA: class I SAM-dependent methyltransferase [Acidimicrobiales bacterium]|nr:class I SAM-dependent methyltransferase [Acidimicrobiales bacterium]
MAIGGDWRATNQAMWDERARAHAAGPFYGLDAVVDGEDHLRPWEDVEVGDVTGLDLVHLQCHIGTDTVGWARRGARVLGLDFSSAALAVAAELSARCRLSVEWVQADVYDAVTAVGDRRFDVVYTGIGALGWLPDLDRWAAVVRELLRPGGFLYLMEIHPMWVALGDDGSALREDAIGADFARYDEGEQGSYGAPDARFEHTASYERLHSLSDVLSAILDGGLRVELFHEFDVTPAPTPWLEHRDDRLYHFGPGQHRFPLCYSVRARNS